MKHLVVYIALFLLIMNSKAEKFNKNDVALCFYLVNVDESFGVPYNKAFWDSIYVRVSKTLQDSAGIVIKPVDFLKEDIPYSHTGYPVARGKKAAKSNKVENYLRLNVDIGPAGIQSTTSSSTTVGGTVSGGKKSMTTKVKVQVKITIFDKTGEEIIDIKDKAVSKNEILVESESFSVASFSMTTFKDNQMNAETFQRLLNEAAQKVSRQLK